jgi:hypothetical protein
MADLAGSAVVSVVALMRPPSSTIVIVNRR